MKWSANYESAWRTEWDALRAERAEARRRWRAAADGLNARAHDPFGLGRLVHDNPIASTGIGAIAGALLVKLVLGRKSPGDSASPPDGASSRGPSLWTTLLRDAALSVVVPWGLRMLKEKFGWDLDPAGTARDAADPTAAASAPDDVR